jgi:CheY-like chemotaxis protein
MLRSLVVDDEAAIRQLVRSLLESAGHQVVTAANGHEAMGTLQDELPLTLMVVDISLGDVSGLEVVKASRRLRPRMAIIAISGYLGTDSVELRRALSQEGVHRALSKPFGAQQFLGAVRETLMEELPRA